MQGIHKFFKCELCGNLAALLVDSGAPLVCCGQKMTKLEPNTVDAAKEKHVPEVTVNGDTINVQVGSVLHPMTEEHNITFIYVATDKGGQRKSIEIGAEPKAVFKLADDKAHTVFAYCNLHGLWKAEI